MIKGPGLGGPKTRKSPRPQLLRSANFKDYRFLQVFYPTRGILAWYSRETGILQPLPGADDPAIRPHATPSGVPMASTSSSPEPRRRTPTRRDAKLAKYANDPNETQIQFDLYRIPFNEGKGGTPGTHRRRLGERHEQQLPEGLARRHAGSSSSGRNGQLMRPDSQLYIVPAEGGKARGCDATRR